ncbi:hypothetical protein BYT27DRAFT_7261120 [Phlegmacium glaucopus]|nr:hypothetical protein BYT27DRAFT_7261120 [Phlegmacium glaucopus]
MSTKKASAAMRTPAMTTVNRQSKRKTVIHSDDSDIEIIDTSTPVKKKCVAVTNCDTTPTPTPTPGSQAFQDLPCCFCFVHALSFSDILSTYSGSSPMFSSQDSVCASDPVGVDLAITMVDKQARPERTKVMTEKVLYAVNAGLDSSAKASSPVKCKGKGREAPRSPSHSLIAYVPNKNANQVTNAATLEFSEYKWPSTPLDQEPDAPGDGDIGIVPHDISLQHDSHDMPADAISIAFEEEDPTTQVMLKSIQDPALAPIYDGLPDLGIYLNFTLPHVFLEESARTARIPGGFLEESQNSW